MLKLACIIINTFTTHRDILNSQLTLWLNNRKNVISHRQLLVISGEQEWTNNIAKAHFINTTEYKSLWVTSGGYDGDAIKVKDYRSKLGHEYDYLVFDAFSGFRANAAMALSGTVKAQGLMIILCPDFSEWPTYQDPEHHNRISFGFYSKEFTSHLYQYLKAAFKADSAVAILTKDNFTSPISSVDNKAVIQSFEQQTLAVSAICKVANGHRNRPLVLTADRGRGKSSALGIAAAQLMQQQNKNIWVTATQFNTIEQVFNHAQRLLPGYKATRNQLQFKTSTLTFKSLDTLLVEHNSADILLIDEAAAIPVDILIQLTKKFSRIVFSTTIHGYEGSGRGFEIRFKNKLNNLKPDYKTIHLDEPIRWHNNDVLEKFWFNTLCYNKTTASDIRLSNDPILCRHLTKKELISSPSMLADIFSLLMDAHYQSSPDDIQRLLDSPESECFILSQNNNILGVAQINQEGGATLAPLCQDISAGTRRVKGHLVAQNIANFYHNVAFCSIPQWRISRIAIHPNLQSNNLGRQLVSFIKQEAKSAGISMLTSAFGCNIRLLNFWHKVDFQVVKLSSKVEVSSGENNCMCISPLSDEAANIMSSVREEFYEELNYQIDKEWQAVNPSLLAEILIKSPTRYNIDITKIEMIKQLCHGSRPFSAMQRVVRLYLLAQTKKLLCLPMSESAFLIALVLQNKTYQQLCRDFHLTGKKQIEDKLKTNLALLLNFKDTH